MRIIAGSLKGRRLATPSWAGLRPSSDKLRETLFNVIAPRVSGARVLDGYAGTGAVGIEALSRGASHVTFVERDPRASRLIAENLHRCRLNEGYTIVRAHLRKAAKMRLPEKPFDLILLDPPYDEPDVAGMLAISAGLLAESGLLVLEHAKRSNVPSCADGLIRMRTLVSGDSALSFYTRP